MNTEGNAIPAAGGGSGREGAPGATDLRGQVAVVTGASRGIGQAIAVGCSSLEGRPDLLLCLICGRAVPCSSTVG